MRKLSLTEGVLTEACFTAVNMTENSDVYVVYTRSLQAAHVKNRPQASESAQQKTGLHAAGAKRSTKQTMKLGTTASIFNSIRL